MSISTPSYLLALVSVLRLPILHGLEGRRIGIVDYSIYKTPVEESGFEGETAGTGESSPSPHL